MIDFWEAHLILEQEEVAEAIEQRLDEVYEEGRAYRAAVMAKVNLHVTRYTQDEQEAFWQGYYD